MTSEDQGIRYVGGQGEYKAVDLAGCPSTKKTYHILMFETTKDLLDLPLLCLECRKGKHGGGIDIQAVTQV